MRAPTHDDGRLSIGLDIGGTKIAAGVVDAEGRVVERVPAVPSPTDQAAILKTVSVLIEQLRSRHPGIVAVGVGAAGLIRWPEGRIRTAPNNGYRDVPLRHLLQESTGLPTVVDNDANAACWAEYRKGHSASYMAFITVGTGVGGGLVLADRLFRGRTGIAMEFGHMIVDPRGTERCGCGTIGCLEPLASGRALGRYGSAAAAAEPGGMLATLAGGPGRVTGETVSEAARAGDPAARAQLERLGQWLGIGIATLVNLFDVELVVIGGGVAEAGDLLLDPIRSGFTRFVTAAAHRELPDIEPARLGPEAGWVGAALLALDHAP
ncbi:ROK family protein [Streptomyces griseocarneus]|uniref:ROK family protein n=1 Tax=Streptomyces griseocarneus TaxID=51201 RepID=UPI00167EF267|nr:ROK family protein [Streptomyces griseocarneus]MBZ6474110.1 ROK family protein [Streptomyces griseocarneus]GHG52149.1 glucokinase [Streptomyces griseocarneus]